MAAERDHLGEALADAESVTDRPTKAHETVFLLTKSARYFFDAEAIKEPASLPTGGRARAAANGQAPYAGLIGGEYHEGRPGRFSDYQPPTRNCRDVWTIATDPLPSIEVDGEKLDHFASYPVELARRCILAGTSAKGCCPECGAPWARQVDRESILDPRPMTTGAAIKEAYGYNGFARTTPQGRTCGTVRTETTGWRPTCSCITENPPYTALRPPIPCTALDPFLGSGRTALACEELGRDCIGIELNPASVQMATAQLERAKARRFIGDAERVPIPEGQLRLF